MGTGSFVLPPFVSELEGTAVVLGRFCDDELVEGFCEFDTELLETELCVELNDPEIDPEVDVGSELVLVGLGRLLETEIEEEVVGRVVISVVVA